MNRERQETDKSRAKLTALFSGILLPIVTAFAVLVLWPLMGMPVTLA